MSGEGKIYKQHYACFRCRKAFKKTNMLEMPKERLQIDERGRVVHCPQCGERMPDVGYDFKAPKKDDVAAWHEAESRLEKSSSHALRNSRFTNVKSLRPRMRFIEDFDAARGVSYSLTPESNRAAKRRKRKKSS